MSKRAEERALEAYPPKFTSGKRYAKRVQSEKVDTHVPIRTIYLKGYVQAEKDLAPLIEAATIVYEAWNGGTMDDVRSGMVELGKLIMEEKI